MNTDTTLEQLVEGMRVITHFGEEVVIKSFRTDPAKKPIIADNNGKQQYYHFNQVTPVV